MLILSSNLCSWGKGKLSIKNRMPRVVSVFKKYSPDFIGVQECTPLWGKFLKKELSEYGSLGLWRDPENTGEACLIFYKKDRFSLLDQGTFWLSETPETCSLGWDAMCRRVCTFGVFKDEADGREFSVFNTHLDHIGEKAQLFGMKQVLDSIKAPSILTGDFNVTEESEAYHLAKSALFDVKYAAEKTESHGTWHAFGEHQNMESVKAIDHIFVTEGVKSLSYRVLKDTVEGEFISDHYPIAAEVSL